MKIELGEYSIYNYCSKCDLSVEFEKVDGKWVCKRCGSEHVAV